MRNTRRTKAAHRCHVSTCMTPARHALTCDECGRVHLCTKHDTQALDHGLSYLDTSTDKAVERVDHNVAKLGAGRARRMALAVLLRLMELDHGATRYYRLRDLVGIKAKGWVRWFRFDVTKPAYEQIGTTRRVGDGARIVIPA